MDERANSDRAGPEKHPAFTPELSGTEALAGFPATRSGKVVADSSAKSGK
jgi:hypothetical protein